MTGNLVEERNSAETIADVIEALCVKRAEWRQRAENAEQDYSEQAAFTDGLRRKLAQVQDERDANARRAGAMRSELAELNERHQRCQANLAVRDGQITELGLYIAELAAFRDAAKTKAERVALGHVVERLRLIVGAESWEGEHG